MLGELITLPLRVGVRATQLCLRATEQTAAVVVDVAGRLLDGVVPRQSAAGQAPRTERAPESERTEPARAEPPARPAPPMAPASDEAPAEPEPIHVSEEPELVEEIAEPGAEDGAGAALHVQEPWEGYRELNADEVIARLGRSDAAELAAIQLYEREHKGRTTVLQAVERELRISTASG
jgi:hypothetical protein